MSAGTSRKEAEQNENGAVDLVYLSDEAPGFRRVRTRTGFRYVDAAGHAIHDKETIARIKKLAIPPAWEHVWISPLAEGHLQATGRDAKGRKQYRYHPQWRAIRDRQKYGHTLAFGEALPAIRQRIDADLRRPGLPREKVLATVIKLLETSLIRVGNEEYARDNGSVGLSTMRNKHARIEGSQMRFEFKGKSGKMHRVTIRNRRLARIVRQCQEIRGYELFQYVDENGERHRIDSSDVNAYLREISEQDFTAKDFRTWAGTVLASMALREFETFESPTEAKHNLSRAVESVAARLGNTPAICRNCYVHPAVVETYLEGRHAEALRKLTEESLLSDNEGLEPDEAAVLALIRSRLRRHHRNATGVPVK